MVPLHMLSLAIVPCQSRYTHQTRHDRPFRDVLGCRPSLKPQTSQVLDSLAAFRKETAAWHLPPCFVCSLARSHPTTLVPIVPAPVLHESERQWKGFRAISWEVSSSHIEEEHRILCRISAETLIVAQCSPLPEGLASDPARRPRFHR